MEDLYRLFPNGDTQVGEGGESEKEKDGDEEGGGGRGKKYCRLREEVDVQRVSETQRARKTDRDGRRTPNVK